MEGMIILDPEGPYRSTSVDERAERDHELRAALCGIESAALSLSWHHDRLTTAQLFELTHAVAAEARRLRASLDEEVERPQPFDLAEAIRPVIMCARSLGVEVRAAVPEGVEVIGRRHDTAQVVFALLDNARKHAAPSPVDIRATVRGGVATLFIEDCGNGIPGALCERVFERGVVGEKTGGSGLGLFIARRLMTEQGGSLSVRSRPCGGASFRAALRTAPASSRQHLRSIPLLSAVAQ